MRWGNVGLIQDTGECLKSAETGGIIRRCLGLKARKDKRIR